MEKASQPLNLPEFIHLKGVAVTRQVWLDKGEIRGTTDPSEATLMFNWGYTGSGPKLLALVILKEYMPEEEAALYAPMMMHDLISALPQTNFEVEIKLKEYIETRANSKDEPFHWITYMQNLPFEFDETIPVFTGGKVAT